MQSIQFNSYQKTTPDELISGILDILIDRNKRDLRLFTVNIRVLTQGLKPVQTSFNVTNI
jgi:hypothetical protein